MNEYNFKSMSVYSLCVGCLNPDRKLIEIVDEEIKTMFWKVLAEIDVMNASLLVCADCQQILNTVVRFKRQVKQASQHFLTYLKNESQSSLSEYQTHTQSDTFKSYSDETIKKDDIPQTNNDETVIVKTENDIEGVYFDDYNILNEQASVEVKTEDDNFHESDNEPLSKLKKSKNKVWKQGKCNSEHEQQCSRVVYNGRVERKLRQLNVDATQVQMIVLSWGEVDKERELALSRSVFTRHQYKCYDCVLGFNHKHKLNTHMNKHTPESGDIVCNVCKIRFKNDKALYAHKRRHRVRWRCTLCGMLWSRAAVCADHVARTHHTLTPTHTCSHCEHVAQSLGKLKLHMRSHSEPVSCEICGKQYKDKDTLRTHLFIHNGEKEYQCKKCDKKFLFKKALEIHELTHGANQFLYCHECDVNFKNHISYYQHMKYNLKHIDPAKINHVCSVCGRRFSRASRLAEHSRATHDKLAPIKCTRDHCDKSFPSRAGLRAHTRAAHTHTHTRTHTHMCHTCGHTYKSKKSLERHVKSHAGQRPLTHTLTQTDAHQHKVRKIPSQQHEATLATTTTSQCLIETDK